MIIILGIIESVFIINCVYSLIFFGKILKIEKWIVRIEKLILHIIIFVVTNWPGFHTCYITWAKSNTHPDIRYPLKIVTLSTIAFLRFLYPPTLSIIYMLKIFRVMTIIIIYFSYTFTDHRAILKTIYLIDKTIDNIPV